MSSKRERRRAKRRNDELRRDAWVAVERGKLDEAERLIALAIQRAPSNARYWYDKGRIELLRGARTLAARSFQAAVERSPKYLEALRALFELAREDGDERRSDELAARVFELDASDEVARDRVRDVDAHGPSDEAEREPPSLVRTERYDWDAIADELTARGCALLESLLSRDECAALIALDEEPASFEHDVRLGQRGAGGVTSRLFRRPLPALVDALREELYWRATPVASAWEREFGGRPFPRGLSGFLERCRRAGQTRSTPLLFRYEVGASKDLHRDLAGAVFFPLQLAVTLGPGNARDGGGGEFVLADVGAKRGKGMRVVATGVGDAVLFCARDRPRRVGGVLGRQPVHHGVRTVGAPRRYALGVPFHDSR